MALYVIAYRSRAYVAGFLRERMPVLRFWLGVRKSHVPPSFPRKRESPQAWYQSGEIPAFAGMTNRARTTRNVGTTLCVALGVLLGACSNDARRPSAPAPQASHIVAAQGITRDDYGRVISFSGTARRVVSLNPTTTETIFAIGAGSRLIGRSHWDEWPAAARTVPDMGNGIGINVEQIVAAHPDLVLIYASEDNRPAAERLENAGVRTLSLRIDKVADFDRAIRLLGRVLGDSARAELVADTVDASLRRVARATSGLPHPSVVWPLIDASPMVVGGGSFMNELMTYAGAQNLYAGLAQPSPLVSMEDLASKNPAFIIRGGEGGSTTPLGGAWRAVPAVALGHVITVPSSLILRPSVQMGTAATLLARALHPGIALP